MTDSLRERPESWRERACAALALTVLREYRLSIDERRDERERLTRALLLTIEAETEQLEHRKLSNGDPA